MARCARRPGAISAAAASTVTEVVTATRGAAVMSASTPSELGGAQRRKWRPASTVFELEAFPRGPRSPHRCGTRADDPGAALAW